jgi:hypothetical protein
MKYFAEQELLAMDEYRRQIYEIRTKMFADYGVDPLDTDTLSSLAIYKIVRQYDPTFNVNFSRNGEDAKSGNILIEQKASRVNPNPLTETGRPRVGYGKDASFQFHAMGDLEHPRYIFVARSETDLSILRIYDISDNTNRNVILDHLMNERNKWLEKGKGNPEKMKHDVITVTEKFILEKLKFKEKTIIDNCKVFKA